MLLAGIDLGTARFNKNNCIFKSKNSTLPDVSQNLKRDADELKTKIMEPVTLITTAISLVTPYLLKTGEGIAESVGEDIWNLIKKPFTKDKEAELSIDINNQEEKDKLIHQLTAKINKDPIFKHELENAVEKGQNDLNALYQQNINNNGQIEKQINIQNNSGNIQL